MSQLIVYDPVNRITSTRYNAMSQTNWVATGTLSYGMGRLTAMQQLFGATTRSYTWQYDAASNITQETSSYPGENTDTYTLDNANQLTGANLTGESYSYDQNGNRTNNGYQTGVDNRLLFDGTYTYQYDKEGNRTARFVSSTGALDSTATDITVYAWDYENRLAMETHYSTYANYQSGSSNQIVTYTYDFAGRMIRRGLDDDGSAGSDAMTYTYTVYDGQNVYLVVTDPNALANPGSNNSAAVSQRDLYAQAVDQILATDDCSGMVAGVLWGLGDNQGTPRDVVKYDTTQAEGVLVNHVQFDSFGAMIGNTNINAAFAFGEGGMRYDLSTKEYVTAGRRYDPSIGRFESADPIGFASGTTNLFAYCGNQPTVNTDPSGLCNLGSVYNEPVGYLNGSSAPPMGSTDWIGQGLDSATTQPQFRQFISEFASWRGSNGPSETVEGMPFVPNPVLYNNGADFLDARKQLVSSEQFEADKKSGANTAILDWWYANHCQQQIALANVYSAVNTVEGAPIRAALQEAQVAATFMEGYRQIEEANPDTSLFGVATMMGLQDLRKYNYAIDNGYTQEQAGTYFDRAMVNGAIFVGTTALAEVGGRLLGAALRPAALEVQAASTGVRFAGTEAARIAPSATLRLSTGVPGASVNSSVTRSGLVNGLNGVTSQSSRVAAAMKSGDLSVNVLGDTMFEKAYVIRGGTGAAPLAFAYGDRLYLRSSSPSLLSDALHEGTHGLDYLNRVPGSNWMSEARAYYYERQFQGATGAPLDFPTNREMWDHIYQNYNPQ